VLDLRDPARQRLRDVDAADVMNTRSAVDDVLVLRFGDAS
jgi:hypothetical protein